jgi:hypothetical protein
MTDSLSFIAFSSAWPVEAKRHKANAASTTQHTPNTDFFTILPP